MPEAKTGLLKEWQHAKEIPEEILKAMERIQAKTENMEIVPNGLRKASVREETRAPSCTIQTKKQRRKEDPALHPKREDTRKNTEKEIPKGKFLSVTKVKQVGLQPLQEGTQSNIIRM